MLTDKEKRVILSPHSFSVQLRKATKFRCKTKIQEIICDMQFLITHQDRVKKEFGIDMIGNDMLGIKEIIEKDETPKSIKNYTTSENQVHDPDML